MSVVATPSGLAQKVDCSAGADEKITLSVPALSTRFFTMSCRLQVNTAPGSAGVIARAGASNILLWMNAGKFDMRVGGTDYTETGTFATGRIYNICIIGDASSCRLYVDGVLVINGGVAGLDSLSDFVFGDDGGGGGGVFQYQHVLFWNRPLGIPEIKSLSANPWQIFKPLPRRIFAPVATSSDILGTLSITEGTETLSASGTVTGAASVDGTANLTESAETVTASGEILVSGSSSTTNAAQSVIASGAVAISGTASLTETAETLSASGALAIDGVATVTEIAETLTASGVVVSGIVGNASITEAEETVTASGAIAIGGTASIAPTAQDVIATGSIAITGTANLYELAETLTASGIALGGITGSASLSQAAQTLSAFATAAFPTIARPTSDVSNAGWTPSTGTDLFAMLDEVSPDDADYISTSTLGAVCKMALNATQYPGSAAQQLSLRASSATGNGLTVTIKDGATTIATRSLTLTPTYDLHTITLTSGEIAAITSGNLTVEMTST
jgi:hypothetical protein